MLLRLRGPVRALRGGEHAEVFAIWRRVPGMAMPCCSPVRVCVRARVPGMAMPCCSPVRVCATFPFLPAARPQDKVPVAPRAPAEEPRRVASHHQRERGAADERERERDREKDDKERDRRHRHHHRHNDGEAA